MYMSFLLVYLRSQVSVYRTIGPLVFSSPEPKAHKVSLLYSSRAGVRASSVVVRRRPSSSTFSNDFSSEAARPNRFIFHL